MARARGVVDQDLKPYELLEEHLGDRIDLSVGIGDGEAAAVEALEGADIAFVTSRIPVTRRVLEGTDLSIVAKIGTGIDNVDLEAARDLGVPVTHTPGINAMAVAEHALGLLLAARRHTLTGYRTIEEGHWRDEAPLGTMLTGTTVGTVGFGNIGRRLASLLGGFDVETLAHDPYVDDIEGEPFGTDLVGFDPLLERSDSLVIAAELTPETRGMIDRGAFERLPDDAVLVNTARGPVVDEDALVEALEGDRIAAAGLDVFRAEPLPPNSELLEFENVIATPHVAGVTGRTRERGVERLAANTVALLEGESVSDRYMAT